MFIFFGTRSSLLKTITVTATCPQCHTTGLHSIGFYGEYAHVFWIPTFPLSQTVLVRCEHCLATYDSRATPADLKKQLQNQAIVRLPTPVWQWIGLALFGALILFCVGLVFLYPANQPNASAREPLNTTDRPTLTPVAPDAKRQALAADPKVGDTYVFNTANQKPRITSVFTISSVSSQAVETQWSVYKQNPSSGRDELLTERKQSFSKADLMRMEQSGTFRSISQK